MNINLGVCSAISVSGFLLDAPSLPRATIEDVITVVGVAPGSLDSDEGPLELRRFNEDFVGSEAPSTAANKMATVGSNEVESGRKCRLKKSCVRGY
ncbi:hypothetical protein AB3S75_022693 [Citrus x aurantiifolia]